MRGGGPGGLREGGCPGPFFAEISVYKGVVASLVWFAGAADAASALLFFSRSRMAFAVYGCLLGLPAPFEDAFAAADDKW